MQVSSACRGGTGLQSVVKLLYLSGLSFPVCLYWEVRLSCIRFQNQFRGSPLGSRARADPIPHVSVCIFQALLSMAFVGFSEGSGTIEPLGSVTLEAVPHSTLCAVSL